MAESYVAGGFLYHAATGQVLLQHRTDDAPSNPNRWGVFGGSGEPEDEGDPVTTWRREVLEELELALDPAQCQALCDYEAEPGQHRYVFYYLWPRVATGLMLHEGQGYGWFTIEKALSEVDLTVNTRRDLRTLRERLVIQ